MSTQPEEIIVIKKKKGGHGGHHGGAWKVAYADFVTAMMSLFIVLWLLSSSEQVKKSVAGYFNDPKGTASRPGTNLNGTGTSIELKKAQMDQLKDRLMESARQLPNFDKMKKQVEITATAEGIRIELMEDAGGTFFELGSAQPTPALRDLLTTLSRELGKMPNRISIEGHTDSTPYSKAGGYGNWELSADRANMARRLMQGNGVGAAQVMQVRGFADQMPRLPADPGNPTNRRITVIVDPGPSVEAPEEEVAAKEGGEGEGGEGKATSGKNGEAKEGSAKGKEGDAKAAGAKEGVTKEGVAKESGGKAGSGKEGGAKQAGE